MARVSIVIPAFGPNALWEATLVSVLANRPDDCEVVVAHLGSYDDPYELSEEVAFVELPAEAALVAGLNAAIEACDSDFVHLLAPGFEVEEGWTEPALRHFHHALVAAVSPVVLAARGGAVVSAGVTYGWGGSRQICGAGSTSDQVAGPAWNAAFYRRSALEALGGFDAELGANAADVDLALTLRRIGYRCEVEPECQVYAPAEVARGATPGFAAGRDQERLFWRHAPATGWVAASIFHPLTLAAEFLSQLPNWTAVTQLAGRIAGCCESHIGERYELKVALLPRPDAIEVPRPRTLSFAAARPDASRRQAAAPTARKRAA